MEEVDFRMRQLDYLFGICLREKINGGSGFYSTKMFLTMLVKNTSYIFKYWLGQKYKI